MIFMKIYIFVIVWTPTPDIIEGMDTSEDTVVGSIWQRGDNAFQTRFPEKEDIKVLRDTLVSRYIVGEIFPSTREESHHVLALAPRSAHLHHRLQENQLFESDYQLNLWRSSIHAFTEHYIYLYHISCASQTVVALRMHALTCYNSLLHDCMIAYTETPV